MATKTTSVVQLTQDQVALVADDDCGWLIKWRWFAWWTPSTKSFYAVRNVPTGPYQQRTLRMHNAIWEHHNDSIPDGFTVDHIDRDTLNNQLSNLRLATFSQQMQNRGMRSDNKSGYRGVCWRKDLGKWQAQITTGGKVINLGFYDARASIEAALAFDAAARIYHDPDFVQLNFPNETPRKN